MSAAVVDITYRHEAVALHAAGIDAIASQIQLNREITAAREEEIRDLERRLALAEQENADIRNKAQALLSKAEILTRELEKKSSRMGQLEVLLEGDWTKTVAIVENRADWQRACHEPDNVIVRGALGDAGGGLPVGCEISLERALGDGETSSLLAWFIGIACGKRIRFFSDEYGHNER